MFTDFETKENMLKLDKSFRDKKFKIIETYLSFWLIFSPSDPDPESQI